MRDIRWDKIMLAEFRSLVFLTEDEDRVLTGWAHDKSITWMSMEYNLSDRTISTILSRLRSLYDQVQPFTPLLPPRNVPGKPESPSRNGRGYFYAHLLPKPCVNTAFFQAYFQLRYRYRKAVQTCITTNSIHTVTRSSARIWRSRSLHIHRLLIPRISR